MIKVSVIIPVYNTEKYLPKCMDSVCNQTLKDIEIICVNDCSTDNSMDILKNFAEKDNRIKLIDLKQNRDVSHARNVGIDLAQGEYIGFVDSDDIVDLDFYEKLYAKAKETEAEVVKGVFKIVAGDYSFTTDFNSRIKKNKLNFFGEFTTAIYNTAFIKQNNLKFREDLKTWEDPLFTLQVVSAAKKVVLIDNTVYNYYRREASKSHIVTLDYVEDWFKAINLYLAIPQNESDYKFLLLDIILSMFFTCLCSVKDIQIKQYAREAMQSVLNRHPEYDMERDYQILYKAWLLQKMKQMAKKIRQDKCF